MRLLKRSPSGGFDLVSVDGDNPPPYAILSHLWTEGQEVTYQELLAGTGKQKTGYAKISFCAERAVADKLEYFWVDTCCIDKTNHNEHQAEINSMFRWYKQASKCYAYLSDVSVSDEVVDAEAPPVAWQTAFRRSRWFKRGWTLQELLAPEHVEFFCKEEKRLGTKQSLQQEVHEITKIPIAALCRQDFAEFSVDERMSWAAERVTTVREDRVYCLLGLFGVFLPLIYGEGEKYATLRLKDEIKLRSEGHGRKGLGDLSAPLSLPFMRNENFVGRTRELRSLEEYLFAPTLHRRMAIYGLGGCGKSALAVEFAYRVAAQHARMVFWVPAISQQSFEAAFREIGAHLRIPGIADDDADVKQLVRKALSSASMNSWLMIVDNADDHEVLLGTTDSGAESLRLYDYLPISTRGAILFTTRSRKMAVALTQNHVLEMTDMGREEVRQLLEHRMAKQTLLDDDAAVIELLDLLTNLPIAIVQAAAYMNLNDVSARDYISLIHNADAETELFSQEFEDFSRYKELGSTFLRTWQISFDQIRKEDRLAADYLSFMACIDRINIPQVLLPPGATLVQQTRALGTLTAYAFIAEHKHAVQESIGGKVYDMHRLVHMASTFWLQRYGKHAVWVAIATARLTEIKPPGGFEKWAVLALFASHALHVIGLYEADTAASVSLLNRVGKTQRGLGQYSTSEKTLRQVLEARKRILGAEHPDLLESMNDLALTIGRRGQYTQAEELFRESLKLGLELLGDEHPEILLDNLDRDRTHHQGNRPAQEGRMHRESLELSMEARREYLRQTLYIMNNMTDILTTRKAYDEAMNLQNKALDISKKVFGEEDQCTLYGMNNMGVLLGKRESYSEAEEILSHTIDRGKRVLGEEHSETLWFMENLADVIAKQSQYARAGRLYRDILELRKKVIGEEHLMTLRTMYKVALMLAKQLQYDESRHVYEQACAVYDKLEEDDPMIRICRQEYQEMLVLQEKDRSRKASWIRCELARLDTKTRAIFVAVVVLLAAVLLHRAV